MMKNISKKTKSKIVTALMILCVVVGVGFIAYPTVSNLWNRMHAARVIENYDGRVDELSAQELEKMWEAAYEYNQDLNDTPDFTTNAELKNRYFQILNVDDHGMIGYITIDKIDVNLPVYHDVEDYHLEVAAGHLKETSFPIGGGSTHAVILGHRGLPGARLFTDLDSVTEDDIFKIHILDRVFSYKVDQIRVVLPNEVSDLRTEIGKDYCTLVTCTPYGVNTHRLLVRGKLMDSGTGDASFISTEVIRIERMFIASVIAIPMLLIVLIYLIIRRRRRPEEIMERFFNENEDSRNND